MQTPDDALLKSSNFAQQLCNVVSVQRCAGATIAASFMASSLASFVAFFTPVQPRFNFGDIPMHARVGISVGILALLTASLSESLSAQAGPDARMNFFLTAVGPGDGANLGGLAGADAYCAKLATEAGSTKQTWHAYLSAAATGSSPAVNAKDRIGSGPWFNYKGVQIAKDIAELHGDNKLTKATVLTQKGDTVNGRGDSPNRHDILTGASLDGTLPSGADDNTCSNWTSNAATGGALVGHFDRIGGGANPTSWNSAHRSSGCGQKNLQGTGGDGLFYCFAL